MEEIDQAINERFVADRYSESGDEKSPSSSVKEDNQMLQRRKRLSSSSVANEEYRETATGANYDVEQASARKNEQNDIVGSLFSFLSLNNDDDDDDDDEYGRDTVNSRRERLNQYVDDDDDDDDEEKTFLPNGQQTKLHSRAQRTVYVDDDDYDDDYDDYEDDNYGNGNVSLANFPRLRATLQTRSDRVHMHDVHRELRRVHQSVKAWLSSGQYENACDAYQQWIEILQELGDRSLRRENYYTLAKLQMLAGRYEDARKTINRLYTAVIEYDSIAPRAFTELANCVRFMIKIDTEINQGQNKHTLNERLKRLEFTASALGDGYMKLDDEASARRQ